MKLNNGIDEKLTNFVMDPQSNISPGNILKSQAQYSPMTETNEEEKPLPREFFTVDQITLAKKLLGKIIIRKVDGQVIKCKIVETEAYGGIEDRGCHAYGGKMTNKAKNFYQNGGHLYVYVSHRTSHCMNIVASIEGDPAVVLIRGVEIIEGYDFAVANRNMKNLSNSGKELTNGPGKLTRAMKIDKTYNTYDITQPWELFIAEGDNQPFEIVVSKRINIGSAGEYTDKPWRFYIKDNKFVSAKGVILDVISPVAPKEPAETDIKQGTGETSLLLEALDKFRAPSRFSSRKKLGKS